MFPLGRSARFHERTALVPLGNPAARSHRQAALLRASSGSRARRLDRRRHAYVWTYLALRRPPLRDAPPAHRRTAFARDVDPSFPRRPGGFRRSTDPLAGAAPQLAQYASRHLLPPVGTPVPGDAVQERPGTRCHTGQPLDPHRRACRSRAPRLAMEVGRLRAPEAISAIGAREARKRATGEVIRGLTGQTEASVSVRIRSSDGVCANPWPARRRRPVEEPSLHHRLDR